MVGGIMGRRAWEGRCVDGSSTLAGSIVSLLRLVVTYIDIVR